MPTHSISVTEDQASSIPTTGSIAWPVPVTYQPASRFWAFQWYKTASGCRPAVRTLARLVRTARALAPR
jgi:hypothetical protein